MIFYAVNLDVPNKHIYDASFNNFAIDFYFEVVVVFVLVVVVFPIFGTSADLIRDSKDLI